MKTSIFLVVTLLLLTPYAAQGQQIKQHKIYKDGYLAQMTDHEVSELIEVLRTGGKYYHDWAIEARKKYFGQLYSKQLIDLIVFIDAAKGEIYQSMVYNNKVVQDNILNGARSVYVLTFMNTKRKLEGSVEAIKTVTTETEKASREATDQSVDKPPVSPKTITVEKKTVEESRPGNDRTVTLTNKEQTVTTVPAPGDKGDNPKVKEVETRKQVSDEYPVNTYCGNSGFRQASSNLSNPPSIQVKYSALEEHRDPVLRRAINSISSLIGGVSLKHDQNHHPEDTTRIVAFMYLGESEGDRKEDKSHLYLAMTRVDIAENAWNRITICGNQGLVLPKSTQAIIHNFGNTYYSKFRLGLATGLTYRFSENFRTDEEDTPMEMEEMTEEEMMHGYPKEKEETPMEEPDLSENEISERVRPGLYLYSTYFPWPKAPPQKASFGISFGTSVTPDRLFNDIFTSITIGAARRGMPRYHVGYALFRDRDKGEHGLFLGFGLDL